ncbi:MAG: hypothetical protein ACLQPH_12745 [Acidimicrobiales bacterium]
MTADRRTRSRAVQPELPLTPPEAAPGQHADDWRLDDETRSIGRQGVAAARARLDRSSAVHQGSFPARRPHGRAA